VQQDTSGICLLQKYNAQSFQGIELQGSVDHLLDLRGMIVPVTLLNISQSLRKIKSGEIVEIVGSDPETKKDLFKILRAFPHELLNVIDDKKVFRVRLRKGNPAS
jgi:tRNA 2-thiouridine synthesizing protein A